LENLGPVISKHGVDKLGLNGVGRVYWNLSTAQLVEMAVMRNEGHLSRYGAFVALTGEHTGRSPNDKYTVKDAITADTIDWGKVNVPFDRDHFDALAVRMADYMIGRDVFVQDRYAGADADHRLAVRIITEQAWPAHFARNMFLQPTQEEAENFVPEFTVLQVPSFRADPTRDGTRTGVFVIANFSRKLVIIGGTSYAGEIKKSVFSVLNFLLPPKGILPMHCSANIGPNGDTAVFFGLSGTGKTTLSADSSRTLIGDDEHGWGPQGVFNFENGCYAKVINLSADAEPEIYATTRRFGTILENVVMNPNTRRLDLTDDRYTENTRGSYPLWFIPNASENGKGGHPRNIIMLTADAFGVLPPVSKLSPEQAMYHFLSGYTARVAGTEKGVSEPSATFSTCFGGPFMPRRPWEYGELLADLMRRHGTDCWLVNTGWSGGAYGVGSRMKIAHTRAMVHGALDGHLAKVSFTPDPTFGMLVPDTCPGVPPEVLKPRHTWADKAAYDTTAAKLAGMFEANFKQYENHVSDAVKAVAIRAKK
jgi:phosphoenolpyruvate carboxykinase (ATP)